MAQARTNKKASVSIVMPVYNSYEYLQRSIESVLTQNYEQIEFIVVDDGSTDNSMELVESYAAKHKNIKVFKQEHVGVSAARNLGLSKASGKWLVFLDSDDELMPLAIERFVATAEAASAEPDIVVSDFEVVGLAQSRKRYQNINSDRSFFDESDKSTLLSLVLSDRGFNNAYYVGILGSPWAKMYSRELLQGLSFEPGLRLREDVLFNLQAFDKATNVAYIPSILYRYHATPESATKGSKMEASDKDLKLFLERVRSFIDEQGYAFLNNCYLLECVRSITMVWKKSGKTATELAKIANDEPFSTGIREVKISELSAREKIKVSLYRLHFYALLAKLL